MKPFVALLRAINVGGTGKLAMADLARLCREAGFGQVRTYIASGNVVFVADAAETDIKSRLEAALFAHAGRPVPVVVRSASELTDVLARNPFASEPGNRTVALFVDEPLSPDALDHVSGLQDEQIRLGQRELFIFYPRGQGQSRLVIPAARAGTARNMNTVAALQMLALAAGNASGSID